jgi:tetratricopeptide (TPR) repeat protein
MNRPTKNVTYNIYIVAIALSVPMMVISPVRAQSAKSPIEGTTAGGVNTTAGAANAAANAPSAAAGTAASPTASSTPSTTAVSTTPATPGAPRKKIIFKPGMEFSIGAANEQIKVTNDAKLAREQVSNSPDSPEAHFVLAVALTRTSQVEEALKEIRTARKLSQQKGGAVYFDQMIGEYEDMLKSYPEDNQIRYHLAWAYYMKAYVLARYSKQVAPKPPAVATVAPAAAGSTPAVSAKPSSAGTASGTVANGTAAEGTAPAASTAASKNWQSEFVAQNSVLKPEELAEDDSPNIGTAGKAATEAATKSDSSDKTASADKSESGDPKAKKSKKGGKEHAAKLSSDKKIAENSPDKGYVNLGEENDAPKIDATKTAFTPPTVQPANAAAGGGNKNFWANPLGNLPNLGPITGMEYATANAAPEVIPQVKAYYRRALKKLDEVIEREPDDMFANLYRAHLKAEYSGDIDSAMKVWESCRDAHPNSPAPYFFLGEGYLKKGNLGQCLTNVSKAIALRSTGN